MKPEKTMDSACELPAEWLSGKSHIGICAGACAPEVLVQDVIAQLKELGAVRVQESQSISENVVFPVPKVLNPDVS
jgi:4-hydroxy-3-methylbut-2-enyl diphosphate reductase